MSFGVVRKVVQHLERKEAQTMPETKSFAESVIKRRIRELEEELEPTIKPTVGFGELTGKVDPRELEVKAKLDKYGCAYEPPLERPEVKAELNRLRLLEVVNPALAYREVTYAQPNRLVDIVGLPPKPAKESAPTPKAKRIQDEMQRIEDFHRTNKVLTKHLQVPVLKARLVEFNEFHKQALKEQVLEIPAGIFEFVCPYCGKPHQIGATIAEWHLRKTFVRSIYCTPNGSQHRLAFELEGIPEEVD